ncbi:hypothetical protein HY620_00735 [Candidatus Uhrbacteria bacterium]|nr:hypothetical protein [Candidatus Uhrbacteria bacterium]
MLLKKDESTKKTYGESATVWEYEVPSERMSFALAAIDGRYPASGMAVNLKCEQMNYVLSGAGVVHSEFGDFPIEEGDVYHVKEHEQYWIEGFHLTIVLVNAPAWKREQYSVC